MWYISGIYLTNISPEKSIFEGDVPFPVWWDMLVPWRVVLKGVSKNASKAFVEKTTKS